MPQWSAALASIALLVGLPGPVACSEGGAAGERAPAPDDDAATARDGSDDGGSSDDAANASNAMDAASSDAGSDASSDASGDASSDSEALPTTLHETGLYADASGQQLAPGVMEFAPAYPLWSDGADKARWLYLPEGSTIDGSDIDSWRFPVGTKAWKEFRQGDKRLETRLLWKTERGWFRMAFAWNAAQDSASAQPDGALDVLGTAHDIPSREDCDECHNGRADRLLGIGALQLSHDGPGLTLRELSDSGRLVPAPSDALRLPAGADWEALGYLHANCGSCHNPESTYWDRVDLNLWLQGDQLTDIAQTTSYLSTVGVALTETGGALSLRIAAGDSDASGLIARMLLRGQDIAMPPLGSEQVDASGVQRVRDFIDGL
ncbi:MAG: hypothetical protein OEZ06_05520 [Myxococcales bacterium]|nr:hypothetical protein [Myxococcales bacterium]